MSLTTAMSPTSAASGPAVTPDLIDAITDAVVLAPDAAHRAVVMSELIDELCDTLQWRDGRGAVTTEVESFTDVTAAARNHRERMTGPETHTPRT